MIMTLRKRVLITIIIIILVIITVILTILIIKSFNARHWL